MTSSPDASNETPSPGAFGAANTAGSLESQQVLAALKALKRGEFDARLPFGLTGRDGQIAQAFNGLGEQLETFTDELTDLWSSVGKEGRVHRRLLRGRARYGWLQLIEAINGLVEDVTGQSAQMARVIQAVSLGDLTQVVPTEVKGEPLRGEFLRYAELANEMVDQLERFGTEVIRVAREVGVEGELGAQASVRGADGAWKELTDNVNQMASNLTNQVRDVAMVTTAVARGDLSRKITVDVQGEVLELKETVNTMVDQLNAFAGEVTRVAREVGTEGTLGGQANVSGALGIWKELTENVNHMADNLTGQVRDIARVATSVAEGNLTRKVTVEVRGEVADLKDTINTMVDQLNAFAGEVTRMAREVGTEGILGGHADVPGAVGIWRDLTDSVNRMGGNLTAQVRSIAEVATAISEGHLGKKITVEASGEVQDLKDTINLMVDRLSDFSREVTRVVRLVGNEGTLGVQANVPNASGIWRDLTANVNELAANLTRQVRAIGAAATAVTQGDLSQTIELDARGELAILKDDLNQMITSLAETTRANTEQDWLKTQVASLTRLLQGQRDVAELAKKVIHSLCTVVGAQHGALYVGELNPDGAVEFRLRGSYAYQDRESAPRSFRLGEGLVGECALAGDPILIADPPKGYVKISSGLGEAAPAQIILLPVVFEGESRAVIELASFHALSEIEMAFLDRVAEPIGIAIAGIATQMQTYELLRQSQRMTQELQTQQEELQQSNQELEEKARELGEQKAEVERKNTEVEDARESLEEKAAQLALTSKYKSEFLANMSHELRTPLNSLLILSQQLATNGSGHLDEKEVGFAKTIHASGTDLLELINEVLDLAKVESGTMGITLDSISVEDIKGQVERSFAEIAREKKLGFSVETDGLVANLTTDVRRLHQILRNLLSNAFKFTHVGHVLVRIELADSGYSSHHPVLSRAEAVTALRVIDTGIGISPAKQRLIFEAFQQAEGGSNRVYGGTGLGLSISREICALLGGELTVSSTLGKGSEFTLYLPQSLEATEGFVRAAPLVPAPRAALTPLSGLPAAAGLSQVDDDRDDLQGGDRVLMVIEDDAVFAKVLRDQGRDRGFKVVVCLDGKEALELAPKIKPDAITLDLVLPDVHGWVVLDSLKRHPDTRHIPVHLVTAGEGAARGLASGAVATVQKPLDEERLKGALDRLEEVIDGSPRQLLVVEADRAQRVSICELIGDGDVEITAVANVDDALEALRKQRFGCVVLNLKLPRNDGFEMIAKIQEASGRPRVPIVVYAGRELTEKEHTQLQRLAETDTVKGVQSPERLLDETALFLHRVEADLPEEKRRMLQDLRQSDRMLEGKQILIVDDDPRNLFATTSLLEDCGVQVQQAENGAEAIALLEGQPGIELVLMDMMMPSMDGYEATRRLRKNDRLKDLPIIALTAKAMQGDREKCLEAGASDYITKPLDAEQLLSLLRVWITR